ncbi:MAG TPA: hypothetical protein VIJ46_05510, partial [Rhabdochlamydiaceae bacterium]
LRLFGVPLFDRCVRIKQAPLEGFDDHKLMLSFSYPRPLIAFDDLNPKKLNNQQTEKEADGESYNTESLAVP